MKHKMMRSMRWSMVLVCWMFILADVSAIRPRHVAFPVVQRDGTTLMVYKNGDGHLAFYTTIDNRVVVVNDEGDYCYAVMGANGRLEASAVVAHNEGERSADEAAWVARQTLRPSDTVARQQIQRRRAPQRKACYASTDDGLGKYGQPSMGAVNSIGEYTIPVIMVEFSDLKFKTSTTKEKMLRYYNKEGYNEETLCVGSVRDYFKSQSRGMFVPTFEIVGKVVLDKGYAHYGGNINDKNSEYDGYDKGLAEDNYFVKEAVKKAVAQGVDFSKYVSGRGVPLVCLLYAGRGEATEYGAGEDYLWPCEYDIEENIEGVHFNSFFVGNELDNDGTLMGMGVFCHEFGHALGLPDFYCTDESYSEDDAMSNWSIMDTGAYVKDARAPIGYNAYERSYMGWLDIPELKQEGEVTLSNYTTETGNPAMLIRQSQKEYFILENRQPGTWYPKDMGSGMLLMRINYDKIDWDYNSVNNVKKKKRAMVVTANGGKMYYSGSQVHLYGNAKKEITSLPLFSGSKLTTKPIYDITKNADGTITFNYLKKSGGGDDTPTIPTDDYTFVKVTSDDQIAPGNRYVLVNESGSVAAGELNGKYLDAVDVIIDNGTVSIGDDVTVFTLGGSSDAYSLQDAAGDYLQPYGDRNLGLESTAWAGWSIDYNIDWGGYIVASDMYGPIQYNKSTPRFLNYLSGSQLPVLLYVNGPSQGGTTPDKPAVDPTDDNVVSGDGLFKRVTTDSELEPNRNYLIVYEVSETKGVALDGVVDDIGKSTEVEMEDGVIDNTEWGAAVVALLDGGNGQWYLRTDDGYLQYNKAAGTKSNNKLFVSDDALANGTLWKVSATDGITNAYNTERKLQYNSALSGLRFCCYLGTQKDVTLYKEEVSVTGVMLHTANVNMSSEPIYDLSGRLLKVEVGGLPKGVYIKGGRKFVVK